MAKLVKKPAEDHSNDWLNTYADMVTLLLTFFVMLYASSSIDSQKWQYIYQAFTSKGKYLNEYVDSPNPNAEEGDGVNDDERKTDGGDGILPQSFDRLYVYLANYVSENNLEQSVAVEQGAAHITIRFSDSVFFEPNSAVLTSQGRKMISDIGPGLRAVQDSIQTCTVSGHTAGGVISPVNDWALSAGRAVSVVNYMEYRTFLPTEKFLVKGCGPNQPLEDNSTEEGRAKNRRVELTFLKSDLDTTDPKVVQDILEHDLGIKTEQYDPDSINKDADRLPPDSAQNIINSINELFPDTESTTSGYAGPSLGDFSSFVYDKGDSSSAAEGGASDSGAEGASDAQSGAEQ